MNSPIHKRRVFLLRVAGLGSAFAAEHALAADPVSTEKLTEADSYAKSMGFRLDTARVDQAKFPRHTTEQHCGVCQLFSGKEGDEWGPCSFFGGRLVNKGGWCRNFKARKAAA